MKKTSLLSLLIGASLYSSITLASSVITGGGYEVEHYSSKFDASYWIVSYYDDITEGSGDFSVIYDDDAEEVTFSFTSADGVISESCYVTPEDNAYIFPFAVELADKVSYVDSFTVYPGTGGICHIVDDIAFRSDVVEVEFNCEEGYSVFGQSVYVVGNTPLLGDWDPARAVKLDPIYYPHWQANVPVEMHPGVEWKCILRDEQDGNNVILWEQGENNLLDSTFEEYVWGRFTSN